MTALDTTTKEGMEKRRHQLAAPYREQLRKGAGRSGVQYAAMRIHDLGGLEPEDMSAITRRIGNADAKKLGYRLGYDVDYIPGMDDGEPPKGADWN
jgi:hypothetical protein